VCVVNMSEDSKIAGVRLDVVKDFELCAPSGAQIVTYFATLISLFISLGRIGLVDRG